METVGLSMMVFNVVNLVFLLVKPEGDAAFIGAVKFVVTIATVVAAKCGLDLQDISADFTWDTGV